MGGTMSAYPCGFLVRLTCHGDIGQVRFLLHETRPSPYIPIFMVRGRSSAGATFRSFNTKSERATGTGADQ